MKETNIKERLDVMMDMETADLAETSAILEIALIPFHMDGSEAKEEIFHEYIDLTSCFLEGMTFSRDTQEAWMKWDTRAKHDLQTSEKTPIRSAISESYNFLNYLNEKYELHLWCRGKNFDIPKYEYCVRTLLERKEMPYKFYHTEDARDYAHTFNVHSGDIPFEGNLHCAFDDCRHQIKQVQAAYKRKKLQEHYAMTSLVTEYKLQPDELCRKVTEVFGIVLTDKELKTLLA